MDPSTLDNPETLPIRRGPAPAGESGVRQMPKPALESASKAGAIETQEAAPEIDPTLCPRCGSKLVNPQDLGWCPKCSYCRSLEADQAAARVVAESSKPKSSLKHFGDFGELIARLPTWAWGTIGCIGVIVAVSIVLNFMLPQEDSLARALISLVAIVVSIVAIFCVNLWALFVLGPNDPNLGPGNVFLFVGLWRNICEALPTTRRQFSSITWCITVILSACFITGGLDYWWEHYKPNRVAKVDILSAATALAKAKAKNRSLEESIDDFAKMAALREKEEEDRKKEKAKAAARETVQCVIIGYTLNADKQLDGLLVAAILNDRIRFAGIVRKGLGPKEVKKLQPILTALVQEKSYIPGLSADGKAEVGNAIWVKPTVFCEITHEEYDENKHFLKSEFKTLLSDNR